MWLSRVLFPNFTVFLDFAIRLTDHTTTAISSVFRAMQHTTKWQPHGSDIFSGTEYPSLDPMEDREFILRWDDNRKFSYDYQFLVDSLHVCNETMNQRKKEPGERKMK
jgi:hypothetical protein